MHRTFDDFESWESGDFVDCEAVASIRKHGRESKNVLIWAHSGNASTSVPVNVSSSKLVNCFRISRYFSRFDVIVSHGE